MKSESKFRFEHGLPKLAAQTSVPSVPKHTRLSGVMSTRSPLTFERELSEPHDYFDTLAPHDVTSKAMVTAFKNVKKDLIKIKRNEMDSLQSAIESSEHPSQEAKQELEVKTLTVKVLRYFKWHQYLEQYDLCKKGAYDDHPESKWICDVIPFVMNAVFKEYKSITNRLPIGEVARKRAREREEEEGGLRSRSSRRRFVTKTKSSRRRRSSKRSGGSGTRNHRPRS